MASALSDAMLLRFDLYAFNVHVSYGPNKTKIVSPDLETGT